MKIFDARESHKRQIAIEKIQTELEPLAQKEEIIMGHDLWPKVLKSIENSRFQVSIKISTRPLK